MTIRKSHPALAVAKTIGDYRVESLPCQSSDAIAGDINVCAAKVRGTSCPASSAPGIDEVIE